MTILLIVEDDPGHQLLIKRHLDRAQVANRRLYFQDGQAILDFFDPAAASPHYEPSQAYLMLLDIRMPKVDGIEVLSFVKSHPDLRDIPVIMVTTTEDPREMARCQDLGCSHYWAKPVDYSARIEELLSEGLLIQDRKLPIVKEPQ